MWRVVPLLVPVVVLAGAACAPDGDPPDLATASTVAPAEGTTTTAPETAVTTAAPEPPDEEAAIIAAVLGYWEGLVVANEDEAARLLAKNASGPAHTRALDTRQTRSQLGQEVQLPTDDSYRHSVDVRSITEATATAVDCTVDGSVLIDARSGRVMNDEVATLLWRLSLERTDRWRVVTSELVRRWDGVQSCEQ